MKLTSIQMLRGLAAFAVAMSHLRAIEAQAVLDAGSTEGSIIGGIWDNGFAGVDLFFVISGFIMVYVTAGRERGRASAGDFLAARVSRIYPLWWLFAAITAVVFTLMHGTPYDPDQFALTGHSEARYLLNSALLLPQAGHPILGVGWTLIHEMYFYVVFAALLLAPQRWLPGLLAAWAVFVIGSDVAGWTSPFPRNLLELATYPMTMEFIAGAITAMLVMSGRRAFPLALTLIGAAAFIASMLIFVNDKDAYTLGWGRVIWFGLPATILIYGLTGLEAEKRFTAPRWLVVFGDISFALYLCHVIVISGMKRVFGIIAGVLPDPLASLFTLGAPGVLDNLLFAFASLSAAVVVAYITYHAFERPSLRVLNRWRKKAFRPVAAPKRGELVRSRVW